MADLRSKQLPNLKISVDNTETTDESSDEELREDSEISFHDDEVEQSEESVEEEVPDKTDVEFNVRIGSSSFSDPKSKQQRGHEEDSFPNAKKSDSSKDDTSTKLQAAKRLPQISEKRVYENKQGGFVTGIDVTSKEAREKRKERAKRFRIQEENEQFSVDEKALLDSLGMTKADFENQEKGLREEAVHLRGTDDMSTKDVFEYFTQFPASEIEWINDSSCNVVWLDKVTCIRALLNLSNSYKDAVAAENKKRKEEKEKEEQKRKGERQKKKKQGIKEEEMKEDNADERNKTGPEDATSTNTDGQAEVCTTAEEEQMEVDDDELDLMVENEDIDLPKVDPADSGVEKSRVVPDGDKTNGGVDKDSDSKGTEERQTLESKPASEKTKQKSHGKDSDKGKDSEKSSKKKDKKEVDKEKKKKDRQKEKEKEKGEESDSSSGSSSRSSSSGSSSGSSSDSDSSSGSSSSSDSSSSSSSDSESEDESKKKKKSSRKSKRDADTGERMQGKGSSRGKKHSIPWPPGKWRLGIPSKKARYLFMRFATKDDKKEVGAEKRSQYYRKYGNPNFGGMKGLISSSRKRKILYAKRDKEMKSQGPDARETIDKKRADRRRQRDEEKEEGELSNEDRMEEQEEVEEGLASEVEVGEEAVVTNRPKDLRQLLNRDVGSKPAAKRPEKSLDKVVVKKRKQEEVYDSEDELDLDAELEQLMEPRPAKKRMMMRMHADDEEERIKAKRSQTGRGLLTVIASDKETGARSRLAGRLGGRLQLPVHGDTRQRKETEPSRDRGHVWNSDGRLLNSEDDEDAEDVEEMDDFTRELESYRSLRNLPPFKSKLRRAESKVTDVKSSLSSNTASRGSGGDLRTRLGLKPGRDSEKRNFPSMRIEVFDEDDDE